MMEIDTPARTTQTPAPEYKLSDAVTLYGQQTTLNYGLWTLFVVVTFALANFGGSNTVSTNVALILTIGYLPFTASNLYLIRRSLLMQAALKKDVNVFLDRKSDTILPCEHSIRQLVEPAGSLWASAIVHTTIDICAIGTLWARALKI